MGNCGSAKKHVSNHHSNDKKNSTSTNIHNGVKNGNNVFDRRKSIKLQEFDRISNMTILDGKF